MTLSKDEAIKYIEAHFSTIKYSRIKESDVFELQFKAMEETGFDWKDLPENVLNRFAELCELQTLLLLETNCDDSPFSLSDRPPKKPSKNLSPEIMLKAKIAHDAIHSSGKSEVNIDGVSYPIVKKGRRYVDLGEAVVIAQESNKNSTYGVRSYLGARISWVLGKETEEYSGDVMIIDDGKYRFLHKDYNR